ncbi:uncharacterized protein LOC125222204 isoform X3 [Salvia hispanica]|uniref:uncharacterized protein LOC125222204 isoform X3 n=1 Tax=Salvia hispanica TaxID=49212 RepID=UPI0020096F1B|nr:uncharacterized protein LOC125222204 isoform X3 [Salvia hispanica]
MALLKFALLCIDLVGWPAIALVYPLFVSIRAVETGSGYHMRKLVRYWIIFSLFSLFEFAFVKLIEWIPFWSGVRLAIIFCLVMPQFEGACLAYQGLVSSFIDRFDMLMEERLCKRRTFLDVVDKYLNENGSEALEKLIASQMTPPEARVENRCLETPLLKKSEQEWTCGLCKMTSVGESTLNAHLQGSMHKSKLEILKASLLNAKDTGLSPLWQVQHTRSISAAWDLRGTYAAAEFKERMPPKEPENTLLKKAEQEWTCDLCKVTMASKSMLNAHLQGSKHKSKLESPKASLLDSKDTGPSPLVEHANSIPACWDLKGTYADSEVKEMTPPKETAEKWGPGTSLHKIPRQEWNCDMCKVTTMNPLTFNGHLQGCKHKAKLENIIKESLLDAKDTGTFSHLQVQHTQPVSAAWDLNGTLEDAKDKEMMPPKETPETKLPETPLLKKAQQEWTAFITSVENAQSIPAGWDLKGTNAAAEVKEIMTPKETAEKSGPEIPLHKKTHQVWNCDQCKVTTKDPLMLNGHLQGCKHDAKHLQESLLDSKETGPILPLVQHTHPVSAAWDLNGTLVAAKDKELMLPKETAETRLPETPLLKKAQQEWTAFITNAEHAQSIPAGWDLKGTYAASEVKEMMPPKETAEKWGTGTPLHDKARQEWNCDLCKVTTTDPLVFDGHLQGRRHKAKLKTIQKEISLDAKDTGSFSPLVQHAQPVSASWDLNGTLAAKDEDEGMMPPKETPEMRLPETPLLKKSQQELTGGLCKATTESELMLNDHHQGSQHKSKLETTLKASLLEAKDTGPSPSAERAQSIPAAWDLKGSYAAAEVEEVMSPKENAEKWGSGTPLLKKWTCDLCNVTAPCEITLNGHLQGRKHKAKLETIRKESLVDAKDTGSFSPLVQHAQPISASWDLNGTLAAKDEDEGMMPPKETPEMRLPETPLLKKSQQELTGGLCKVTTESELMLNDHHQGSQHKSKLETTLKASLLEAKDTGPSPSVERAQSIPAAWDLKGSYAAAEVEEVMSPKENAEKWGPGTPLLKKWTCDLCNVTAPCEITLNGHLQGRKHKAKLETIRKESLVDAKDTGSFSPLVQHTQPVFVFAACDMKGTLEAAKDKGIMPPKEAAELRLPETPLLKEAQQELTSDLCRVTTESESMLNDHLQGSQHKSKLETTLNASLFKAKDTGPSLSVNHMESVSAARDLKGTYAAAEGEDLMPPKETAENRHPETPLLKKFQPDGTDDVFNVTTKGESMLNDHVQGNQHKSKLERTLEASLLKTKDTGLSSLLQHTQPVSAAWVLKGTYVASEAREIRTPKETAEKRSSEIPLVENAQQKWTSDPCKVTTTNKITLNGHPQETKHKDKLEFTMKESLLELEKHTASKNGHVEGRDSHRDVQVVKSEAKNGSPAALKEVQYMQPIEAPKCTYSNTEVKETKPPLKASRPVNPPFKKEWIAKSEAKTGSSALPEVQQYAQPLKVPEKTYANTEVKETLPPPEASRAVTPPLKQEWSCALCKVKVTGEKDLNSHLLGSKHKAKLESLKTRKGKPVVLAINGTFRHWCILCDVKLATDVDLASHIGGKRHASRIDKIEKLETSLSAGQCR